MKYADSVTQSFLEYSSPSKRYAQDVNKFVDYQDPTYIGFYLKFPQLSIAGLGEKPAGDYTIFKSLDDSTGGLFLHEDHPDSAIKYLKSMGEYTRAQMVKELMEGLYYLQSMPWYIQKVSGLEEVWKIDPAQNFRGKDKKLVFDTLESLDLKMTYLMDLYRKAAFDSVYMRWMLPSNLRKFKMELVLTEIRSFHRPITEGPAIPEIYNPESNFSNTNSKSVLEGMNIPGLAEQGIQSAISSVIPNSQWASGLSNALIGSLQRDGGSYSDYPTPMKNFDDLATFIRFRFEKCEFELGVDSPTYFGSLTKTPDTPATNKLTIKTPIVKEYNSYGLLGAILEDTYDQSWRDEKIVPELFYNPKTPPTTVTNVERDFLSGMKTESFDQVFRNKSQQKIKEANIKVGGVLGSLLGTAMDIGRGALNNALQGSIAKAALGNVFDGFVPPAISKNLAEKVVLNSPDIITHLIADVVLDSAESKLNAVILPENVGLTSQPQKETGKSKTELTGFVLSGPPSSSVSLEAPPKSAAENSVVSLTGPEIGEFSSTNVELTPPPSGPAIAAKVNFDNNANNELVKSDGFGESVKLEGIEPMDTNPGSVDLASSGANSDTTLGVITFSSNTAGNETPGTVELTQASIDIQVPGKTILDSVKPSDASGGTVKFEEAKVSGSGSTQVIFNETPEASASKKRVEFDDNGSDTNGKGGNVAQDSVTISESALNTVEFTNNSTKSVVGKDVEFDTSPPSNSTTSSVKLESANSSQNMASSVEFTETPVNKSSQSKVELTGNQLPTSDTQKVELISASINKPALDTVSFDEARVPSQNPGSVIFTESPTSDEKPGRVMLEGTIKEAIDLQGIDLDGPNIKLEGELGTVSMDAPPETTKEASLKANLEGPDIQIDINRIGNTEL